MLRAYFQFQPLDEKKHISKILEIILWTLIVACLFIFHAFIEMPEYWFRWILILGSVYSLFIPLLILNRRGHTQIAGFGLVIGLWTIITGLCVSAGGVAANASFVYIIIVYIAGILLGARAGIITALFCVITILSLVIIETNGYMPTTAIPYTPLARGIVLTVYITIMVGLQFLAAQVIKDALHQTRRELDERKRVEEALRESERRFSDMLTNLQMIAVMTDKKGDITFCNDYLLQLTGWEREEAIGQNWFEMFIPQHEQQKVTNLLVDVPLENNITPHFVNDIKTRANEHRLVKWTNTTLRDLEGHVSGVAALGDDVTENKKAEEENRKLLHNLKERVKELTALHGASDILQRQMSNINGVLQELATILLPAFQNPESTAARLRLGQIETTTPGFVESSNTLQTEFTTVDGLSGSIEVIYPPEMEGQFLAEERSLIDTLGDMLQTSYNRHQAEQQLKTTTEQLRALMVRFSKAREEEGTRIAREIHDELGSAMTSLRWGLESLNKTLSGAENGVQFPSLQEKIAVMLNQVDATINVVRRIASELRPSILDDLGLVEAIEWQTQQFQERTGIICRCNCKTEDIELNQEQSTAIFRIFQEALTNILRHAQATEVEVNTEEINDEFVLTIKDNGRGITGSESSGLTSLGILGMRERVALVGGTIEINGQKDQGTMLTVQIPISGGSGNPPLNHNSYKPETELKVR